MIDTTFDRVFEELRVAGEMRAMRSELTAEMRAMRSDFTAEIHAINHRLIQICFGLAGILATALIAPEL